jgi:hypothetical protein
VYLDFPMWVMLVLAAVFAAITLVWSFFRSARPGVRVKLMEEAIRQKEAQLPALEKEAGERGVEEVENEIAETKRRILSGGAK